MIKFFRVIRRQLLAQKKLSNYIVYAIGEIILVVLGILIALQINNWNETRKSIDQEHSYLTRLLSENKQDLITFSASIQDLTIGKESITQFSEALKSHTINDSTLIQTANAYFKYGSIFPVFSSSSSTFEDLSSTGNLKVIRNTVLRESVVEHYANQKKIAERIQIAVNWTLPLDAPFTYKNNIMKFEPSTAFLFPEQSSTQLAKELRDQKLEYISNAAAHYWINSDAIDLLHGLMEKTTVLISKLEAELL